MQLMSIPKPLDLERIVVYNNYGKLRNFLIWIYGFSNDMLYELVYKSGAYKMRIFYYTWFENSEHDMSEALVRLGYEVLKCHIPFADYEEDVYFTENFERIIKENKCDLILSFDFFPIIAKSADRLKIRYVSWVYDMPHHTVYSPSVKSDYVSLFLFDKNFYLELKEIKSEHIYHLPLAVNTVRLNKQLGETVNFTQEISFVGSLYEKNDYRKIQYLPDYVSGYVQGIIEAQKRIYGCNLVKEALHDDIKKEIEKYVILNMYPGYLVKKEKIYVDMINAEVTCQERMELLEVLARKHEVKLYTGSGECVIPGVSQEGIVSYMEEMPRVFRNSKINLNITLRSIESGIPLRALDIMGAGGFLLSNYQVELAEDFVDGQELVLFDSKEDMLEKADYYLENEEERKRIARNGWEKIQREYSYEVQLKKIFERI